jgi:cobalamin biosynthesis protein CbiG
VLADSGYTCAEQTARVAEATALIDEESAPNFHQPVASTVPEAAEPDSVKQHTLRYRLICTESLNSSTVIIRLQETQLTLGVGPAD